MSDLYGDGATDIIKYMGFKEEDVIRALINEVKNLTERRKQDAEILLKQVKLKEDEIVKIKESHKEHIEYMDEIARDGGLTIKCRCCGEHYELPCELSEMSEEGNYCNSGHGGAYHCAP